MPELILFNHFLEISRKCDFTMRKHLVEKYYATGKDFSKFQNVEARGSNFVSGDYIISYSRRFIITKVRGVKRYKFVLLKVT